MIEEEGLLERAGHIGDVSLARLEKLVAPTGPVGEARGRGAMAAVELVSGDGRTADAGAAKRVAAACHRRGVLVLTAGTYGNVIRLLPPLVISDELLGEGLEVLEAALQEL
jgi:4-aminobutyrate aminotransferase / (S)-3-amino-2-methylpropionate transaminase / 5-aminovalerate transaminase